MRSTPRQRLGVRKACGECWIVLWQWMLTDSLSKLLDRSEPFQLCCPITGIRYEPLHIYEATGLFLPCVSVLIGNSSFERVEQFKYLGTNLTNQNSIQEEIKSRLKSGNDCCHSVQNLLSSSVLSKYLKIKIYITIIFPVVLYGCETWSLILREELRLRVFENRVLRKVFGPKTDKVTDGMEKIT